MPGDIFFSMFYFSLIKKLRAGNPENFPEILKRISDEIAPRLCEHFCNENSIYSKIEKNNVGKYLKIFFKMYFLKDIKIEKDSFKLDGMISKYDEMELLIKIINYMLHMISEDVYVTNNLSTFYINYKEEKPLDLLG